ncbi:MAG: cytochrome c maturation protein CcmE [Bacteroidetes bacterium]|nr:MAG: cytochrome c maturation protein CcmE [Bacteroidota bacterium]
MKKTHFIAVGLIGLAIFLLTRAAEDMSTYATFQDARQTGQKVKIAGQLVKNKEMYYNPEEDPNYFSFYIEDRAGEQHQVVLKAAKPRDFELSEQIVVTGKMQGEVFVATDMLMKCPSKYKNEEIFVRSKEE